jgi:hypothetical protein
MLSGKRIAYFAVGLSASLAVCGCMSLTDGDALPPPTSPKSPTPPKLTKGDPAPELRIPADPVVVARGQEIPVVPLPPIPRAVVPPTSPAVVQVSGSAVQVPSPAPTPLPAPPPVVVKPPQTTEAAPATEKGDAVKHLYQQAADAYAGMDSYIARLTRREVVGGKPKPEEVMLFKFRKQPWSVYFKWLSDEGKGREVVYVKGMYENKINTLLANGDVLPILMPADHRMALAVDSILVRNASRHSIADAGIGACIESLGKTLDAVEHGDKKRGTIADLGLQKRPEYPQALPLIEHTIPPGVEDGLPRGGKRLYGFDPENHLPVLVVTHDDKGQEVEYYHYDRLQLNVKLDADDFDPDKLWKAPAARPSK